MGSTKRWAARAILQPSGRYLVTAPTTITPAELLIDARRGSTLIGFDFPIGLPVAYEKRVGVRSFADVLPLLGQGDWASFFEVANSPGEIALHRPFYPARPGSARREHLVEGLGLKSVRDLYRRCDVAVGRPACPLFWTLGGNQVGRAAITGWREFLQPARMDGVLRLWPFDGAFDEVLESGRTVVAETYPAISYAQIGAPLPATAKGRGKRSRESRAASAPGIVAWAAKAKIGLSADLLRQLRDGFGDHATGEDRFDAVAGLLGMLAVVEGILQPGIPDDANVRQVEGWILGRFAT